uniref:peptidoglycan-binding domain-containing protein n=1 Tax=Candidatus Electronema sp. TaxID=2698783 RepID=UPI00405601CC
MKNLLAYTPETFDNLELENFEYAPLVNEMDNEEGFLGGKKNRRSAAGRTKGMSPRRITSAIRKPGRIFSAPRQPMRPLLPPPRIGTAASVNVFPPADDRRPSGQSSSSGNAGSEGSFGNAPAQDVSSEHVRWVQETLNRALGLRLIVDGIMNRETRSAVRMFQERKGLPVTGLMGPDTEEALRAEGGQAAELLEGEWEMEEFNFEAEPFNAEVNSSYVPSNVRMAFETALAANNWRNAFLNLNGLKMYEMLRALDELPPDRLNALMAQRHRYVNMVNLPRIEFALHVVENRAVIVPAPQSLPADQIQIAGSFLGGNASKDPLAKLSPKDLAISDKPLAELWLKQGLAASQHLYDLVRGITTNIGSQSQIFAEALAYHFKIHNVLSFVGQPSSKEKNTALQRLKIIRDTYQLILTLFPSNKRFMNGRVELGASPAYAYWNSSIFFTRFYRVYNGERGIGCGRTARSAMILHEYVHVVNQQSGQDQNHISEFDPKYNSQPPERAVHNPSSYSAFGQHTCYGEDTRFGLGEDKYRIETPPCSVDSSCKCNFCGVEKRVSYGNMMAQFSPPSKRSAHEALHTTHRTRT